MTELEALQKLLAKVEAGELGANNRHWLAVLPPRTWDSAWSAYNGSLDAAKELHEAVLDGYWWKCMDGYGPGFAQIGKPEIDVHSGVSDTNPARAWLIAIIKALIANETPEK